MKQLRLAPARQRVERLFGRVRRLPAADRLFVELLLFRKMTPKQVAAVLGVARKEVYIRYGEIMGRLSRPPRPRGPVPVGGPPAAAPNGPA